jgi:hypothetical protein
MGVSPMHVPTANDLFFADRLGRDASAKKSRPRFDPHGRDAHATIKARTSGADRHDPAYSIVKEHTPDAEGRNPPAFDVTCDRPCGPCTRLSLYRRRTRKAAEIRRIAAIFSMVLRVPSVACPANSRQPVGSTSRSTTAATRPTLAGAIHVEPQGMWWAWRVEVSSTGRATETTRSSELSVSSDEAKAKSVRWVIERYEVRAD